MRATTSAHYSGFTLIELSIVLVIIGLIVGGVLVGKDLISAAAIRAQISQIEKYNTAANTFKLKYGYFPGDIPTGAQLGFIARGSIAGQGDGNGLIEGFTGTSGCGWCNVIGETTVFWVDLSAANLIDGSFNTATELTDPFAVPLTKQDQFDLFYPEAKIGGGANHVYVWSGGGNKDGVNYFTVSQPTNILVSAINAKPGFSVQQAYSMDTKIDDGMPQLGRVRAVYLGCCGANDMAWSDGDGGPTATATATPPTATTCYDDGGVTGTPRVYSMSQNKGDGVNCALSFKFQ